MNIIRLVKLSLRRWDRKFTVSKRQQFVVTTILLTAGLILTQLVPADFRYPMVGGLSIAAFLLTAFCLREDLRGIEWGTLLTIPTMFTAAIALFYFLLPVRWLTRLPVAALYAVGMYALLLTENIYNVAAERTIALLRAAHSVGFLLTLATYFFLVQTVLAFRLSAPFAMLVVGGISFPLFLQSLWAMELSDRPSRGVWELTIALTVCVMELVWAISFLPIKTTLAALFFTTCFYSFAGMAQQYLVEKLYKKTVVEFFFVCAVVLVLILITTHWRGNI